MSYLHVYSDLFACCNSLCVLEPPGPAPTPNPALNPNPTVMFPSSADFKYK